MAEATPRRLAALMPPFVAEDRAESEREQCCL